MILSGGFRGPLRTIRSRTVDSEGHEYWVKYVHNLLKEETEDRYTDDFVVEIEGGNFTAVRIAEECGLDYVEEVFPNHFHFKVR